MLEVFSFRVTVVMATTSDPLILSQVILTSTSVVTAVSTVTEQVSSWDVPAVSGDVGVVRITIGGGTVETTHELNKAQHNTQHDTLTLYTNRD